MATKDYKIVGVSQNHNIMLEFDGKRINFPLPVHDGLYPVGAELDELLSVYVANARASQAAQDAIVAGNAAVIQAMVVEPTPVVPTAESVLAGRGRLLNQTDWTQANDSPLSTGEKAAWATYRQALRDLTDQAGYPNSVVWPVPPSPVLNPRGLAITNVDGSPAVIGPVLPPR
jgi:hypothetical protein